MAEETERAELAGVPCVAGAVAANALLGLGFISSVLYCMNGPARAISQEAADQDLDVVTFVVYRLLLAKYGEVSDRAVQSIEPPPPCSAVHQPAQGGWERQS